MNDNYFKYLVLWALRILVLYATGDTSKFIDTRSDTLNAGLNQSADYMIELTRKDS